jgi:catechol 2,3-dioxygenase-like lactoylglutathione lyase family enzyme
MTATALRGFATINLWADDVAAARDWYAGFLGMPAYFERTDPDGPAGLRRIPRRRLRG